MKSAAAPGEGGVSLRQFGLGAGLILLLTLSAYLPALRAGFIWDDDRYVTENIVLAAPDGLRRVWTLKQTDQYYPLTYTSFWIERKLWGLDPMGYHLVNVLLHALNAVLAWLVLARCGLRGAWLAAAIFALHPVHVETVAWVTERKNLLSVFFYLLALGAYLRFEEGRSRRWYFGAMILFVLALLSKTVACTLPVVLLMLRWRKTSSVGKRDALAMLPFFALGAGFGLMTSWIETHHTGAWGPEFDLSSAQRLLVAGRAFWFYIMKLAWPSELTFNYERWVPDAADPVQWLWVLGVLGLGAGLWRLKGRLRRDAAVGTAFFAVTIFPALGFFKIYPQRYSYVADHFQYLASLGMIAMAAGGFVCWAAGSGTRRVLRPAAVLCAGVVLAGLWTATWRQSHVYHDLETLWVDTLEKNPDSFLAHLNLGAIHSERGDRGKAIFHFREAIRIKPELVEAHNHLGSALVSLGRLDEAKAHFLEAIRFKPDYAGAFNNLGLALAAEGRWSEAVDHYWRALEISPYMAAAYYNLGLAKTSQGRVEEALRSFRRVLRLEPEHADSFRRIGSLLLEQGRTEEAAANFRRALELKPGSAGARAGLNAAFKRRAP